MVHNYKLSTCLIAHELRGNRPSHTLLGRLKRESLVGTSEIFLFLWQNITDLNLFWLSDFEKDPPTCLSKDKRQRLVPYLCVHSRHALNSFIKHQTTKVRMFAELELPYDLISWELAGTWGRQGETVTKVKSSSPRLLQEASRSPWLPASGFIYPVDELWESRGWAVCISFLRAYEKYHLQHVGHGNSCLGYFAETWTFAKRDSSLESTVPDGETW